MIRKSSTNPSDYSREPRDQVQGPQWRQLHRQGQERTRQAISRLCKHFLARLMEHC